MRWGKNRKPEGGPITAPAQGPRPKTYSAASGYVYEYAFVGQREHPGEMEYLFEVSYDRVNRHRISVFVSDAALAGWVETHGRSLTASERYAVSKIALRNAFDERSHPEQIHERIAPGAGEVNRILEELDV